MLLAAGCVDSGAPGTGRDPDAVGAVPRFHPPVPVSLDWPGAEPVIAVASDGTLYVEGVGGTAQGNVNKVWRSDDDGALWIDITPPGPGQERSNDGFVAVGNGDSVYAANVFSLTFQVYRSDDRGETWIPLNVPRLPALMHRHWINPVGESTVHVTVEALPPSYGPRLVGLPVDGPASPNEGMWYFRSDDKGATWTEPVQIDPTVNFAGQGNMVVSEDGQRLYVPRYEERDAPVADYSYDDGHWYLLASEDGGATWARREMFDLTAEMASALPSLALDAGGDLHFAWSMESAGASRVHLSTSRDGGATWSAPRELPLPLGTHAMPWITARAPGVLGLMWYAADTMGAASEVDADWFVDYAVVEVGEGSPRVSHARVTPEPIHKGNVCAKGPACEGQEDRSLLDYPWLVFAPDGGARLVFASTLWDKPSAFAVFAREAI